MRLILMGTGPFAVPSFDALLSDKHEIVHVITRPVVAKPSKNEVPISPVRQWALDHQLPIADPPSVNDDQIVKWLGSLNADLMVVCDYGQILSKDALRTTRLGGINLHGSLLPRHRGAAPVQWSILAGDRLAGISTIHMTPALDGGPILHQASTEIGVGENAAELETRLSLKGVETTLASVNLLATKSTLEECLELGQKQDKSMATKAPRLAKDDGEINCHYTISALDRLVRGLQNWPSTFAHLLFPDGKTLRAIIPRATPLKCDIALFGAEPGELLYGNRLKQLQLKDARLIGNSLWMVAMDGLLSIPCIQPSGKKLMASEEFVRGYSRYESIRVAGVVGSHRLLEQISKIG